MTTQEITLELPEPVYDQIRRDAALWQAARSTMLPIDRERLEALHEKQQREGISAEEVQEEQALLELYQETLLVRAQAALLLKQRGYDVSDPQPFAPLV